MVAEVGAAGAAVTIRSGPTSVPTTRTVAAMSAVNADRRTIETGIVLLQRRAVLHGRTGDSTTAGYPDELVPTQRSLQMYESLVPPDLSALWKPCRERQVAVKLSAPSPPIRCSVVRERSRS